MSRLQSLLLGVFLCLPAGCQTASNKPDFGALLGTDVFGDIQSRARAGACRIRRPVAGRLAADTGFVSSVSG